MMIRCFSFFETLSWLLPKASDTNSRGLMSSYGPSLHIRMRIIIIALILQVHCHRKSFHNTDAQAAVMAAMQGFSKF